MLFICRSPGLVELNDGIDETSASLVVTVPDTAPPNGWSLVSLTACPKGNGTACSSATQCPVAGGDKEVVCTLEGLEPNTRYVVKVS